MKKLSTVDAYIKSAPLEVQGKLKELRAAIRQTAPKALEKISYGMPYYGYMGRLAYFRHWKNHIGLYLTPPVIEMHKDELKEYVTAKATIRFPLSKKLPIPLIKKLIRIRMKMNEGKK
ncbi:DUF1801 domain-containing protein [Candidatus Micrarchaeota archaeon]|nr:DUF1801 domain-containing protein [Candidatus Micrarchaeota archaeon]